METNTTYTNPNKGKTVNAGDYDNRKPTGGFVPSFIFADLKKTGMEEEMKRWNKEKEVTQITNEKTKTAEPNKSFDEQH